MAFRFGLILKGFWTLQHHYRRLTALQQARMVEALGSFLLQGASWPIALKPLNALTNVAAKQQARQSAPKS